MPVNALSVEALSLFYGNNPEPALNKLSFQVQKGDFFGLPGPNGAGKTSLFAVTGGLLKAASGKVYISDLESIKHRKKIKYITGFVPQDIALYEKMTAFENLWYFGRLFGIQGKTLKNRINLLLDRLLLTAYKHRKVHRFSGGMKRRLNLLAGLVHNPEIIFLDEPVTGVDVQSKKSIHDFLRELNQAGHTVIYTSHILEDIEKLCNRIAIIDYGEVKESGDTAELLARHADCRNLEELFIKITGANTRDK